MSSADGNSLWLGIVLLLLLLPILRHLWEGATTPATRRVLRGMAGWLLVAAGLLWPFWMMFRHGFALPVWHPSRREVVLLLNFLLAFEVVNLLLRRAGIMASLSAAQGHLHWVVPLGQWLRSLWLYQPERVLLQVGEWLWGGLLVIWLWQEMLWSPVLMMLLYICLCSLARAIRGFSVVIAPEGVQVDPSLLLPWSEFYEVKTYLEGRLLVLSRRTPAGWGDVVMVAPNEAFALRAHRQIEERLAGVPKGEWERLERQRRRALGTLRGAVWLWMSLSVLLLLAGWERAGMVAFLLGGILLRGGWLLALQPRQRMPHGA